MTSTHQIQNEKITSLAHWMYTFDVMLDDIGYRYRFHIVDYILESMNCPTCDQDIGFSPFSICPHCGSIISLTDRE